MRYTNAFKIRLHFIRLVPFYGRYGLGKTYKHCMLVAKAVESIAAGTVVCVTAGVHSGVPAVQRRCA